MIVENIRSKLEAEEEVESKKRDLIVAATGFEKSAIKIEVDCHYKSRGDVINAAFCTKATNIINEAILEYALEPKP